MVIEKEDLKPLNSYAERVIKPCFNPFKQKIIPSYSIQTPAIDHESSLINDYFADEKLFSSSPPTQDRIDMATLVNSQKWQTQDDTQDLHFVNKKKLSGK